MKQEQYHAVLGVHPSARGMGWVIATSPLTLIDWGVIRTRGDKNATCLKRLNDLIDTYSPATIVVKHAAGSSRKRIKRIQRLLIAIVQLSRMRGIEVQLFADKQLRAHFERFGARSREDVAAFLATNIDALSSRLPPRRKPWMSEDARLGLFDAAALAVAFFIERDLIDNPFADRKTA